MTERVEVGGADAAGHAHDEVVRKMVLGFSCGHWDEFNVDPECEWSVGDTVACAECNDLALVVCTRRLSGEHRPAGSTRQKDWWKVDA